MKLEARHSDKAPTFVGDVQRLVITGRKGHVIELVEQANGGFSIAVRTEISSVILIEPIAANIVVIKERS